MQGIHGEAHHKRNFLVDKSAIIPEAIEQVVKDLLKDPLSILKRYQIGSKDHFNINVI